MLQDQCYVCLKWFYMIHLKQVEITDYLIHHDSASFNVPVCLNCKYEDD